MTGQYGAAIVLLIRDALMLGLTLWLWLAPSLWAESGWAANSLLALLTVLCAYLLHEWGHLLGAVVSGSRVHLPSGPLSSPFLFRFDVSRNTSRQFCSMSLGGFAASLIVLALMFWLLPSGLLASHITLGLAGLGVLATLWFEWPVFWRVWQGGPLPSGAAFVSD